jgi:hypothetical protein
MTHAGTSNVTLDASDLRPGAYFYELKAGSILIRKKCLVVK